MDAEAVADELYALRPEDFTAARNARAAQARKAGDRALAEAIGRMRRPSLSAWAGNLLVRERPEEVRRLLRLGEGLRQAHRELDGARLRELSRRQRDVIGALSRQARHLAAQAGHPLGAGAQREVENTLHAVLADPGAAGEWASGRLDRPLGAASGFPAVAEGAAPRREPAPPRPAPAAPDAGPARPSPAREETEGERSGCAGWPGRGGTPTQPTASCEPASVRRRTPGATRTRRRNGRSGSGAASASWPGNCAGWRTSTNGPEPPPARRAPGRGPPAAAHGRPHAEPKRPPRGWTA
ncbi:hypothetical protein AB0L74_18835 [Streptomyces sp. NPDC052020]|uniref:hypothetical protein n=1 Tax=Streptomyces sp. NPDC052020 TaxID=3155677 RepID=UPI0034317B13